LSHLIKKHKEQGKKMDESKILNLFTQMAMAIKHVHSKKILHRDLKAGNVFLT